jgi:antitoxin component of RelBE/YafQ-DinJ toxin-antitoxin module
MLDGYKIEKPTDKLQTEVEKSIVQAITAMSEYMKLTPSELVNTALKRFIVAHKDFLPPNYGRGSQK